MRVGSSPDERRRNPPAGRGAFAALLIVAAGILAYANSFSGALVLDDIGAVAENVSIRQLWPPGDVLSPPQSAGSGGRPVANLSLAINYALGGLDVRGYRQANLVLHVLTALTLFGVLRRTLRRPVLQDRFGAVASPLALAVAVLWTVHPLGTAVVDYVSQRTEGLMALFYLLTLYAFIRSADAYSGSSRGNEAGSAKPMGTPVSLVTSATRRWQILSVAACALGMGSKEVMVTAPLLVLLYDRTFIAGTWTEAWRRRRSLHLALAATWLVLGWLMISSRVGDRGVGFGQGVTGLDYLLTACTALTRYLSLALWPHPLVFDYGWAHVRDAGSALPHAIAWLALAGGTLHALWRRPVLGFAGCWFLLILAPTSSIVPVVNQPIAESRAYLPLAGIVAFAVAGGFVLLQRRIWAAVAIAALAGGMLTVERNRDYHTPLRLWSDTLAKQPDNARAHCELGRALVAAGRTEEGLARFHAAVKLRPDYPEAHNNIGAWLVRVERAAEALGHLDTALRFQPDFADAHYNRGLALAVLGRPVEAIASFDAAVRFKPDHMQAHVGLGVAHLDAGRVARAIEHDEIAVRLDPNFAAAHHNLGNAFLTSGRLPEAIERYRTALRLEPGFFKAEHNLAVALLRSGDVPGAIAHFEAALRLNPNYAEARRNLEAIRSQGK